MLKSSLISTECLFHSWCCLVSSHCPGKHRSRFKDVEIVFWTCRHLVRFFKDALNILSNMRSISSHHGNRSLNEAFAFHCKYERMRHLHAQGLHGGCNLAIDSPKDSSSELVTLVGRSTLTTRNLRTKPVSLFVC